MQSQIDIIEDESDVCPIDTVEDVLSAHNWCFNRLNCLSTSPEKQAATNYFSSGRKT